MVDNYNDGHYMPDYAASLVTPKRSLTDDGWFEDGTHVLRNTGANVLDIDEGSYPGTTSGSGTLFSSSGQNNDFYIDHTSRNSNTTFTLVVTHNSPGNPTPTCSWAAGTGAGVLTIGFEDGVTTAADMVSEIRATTSPPSTPPGPNQLTASLANLQGEGTLEDPTLYSPRGGDPPNNRGFGAGACNYCHDAGLDAASFILDNHGTHHDIGLPDQVSNGAGGTWRRCNLCHDYVDRSPHLDPARPTTATYSEPGGPGFDLAIRICEECHSVESLHRINTDSNGDGNVEDGMELAGFGHVGRDNGPGDSDCWGCHGFEFPSGASLAPFAGPTIPTLYNTDLRSIRAGKATTVVVSGAGFTNTSGSKSYEADIRLTAADGSSVTLQPDLVLDEGSLAVTIPAKTRPGNYRLQAVKGDVVSNPEVITVSPWTRITRATYRGNVTILGTGFGGYAEGAPTSVTGTVTTGSGRRTATKQVQGSVVSWTDTKIVVSFGTLPRDVTVNSVFGTAKATVSR